MSNFSAGLLGEWQAARHLKRQGMRILEKRYRTAHGEIDLIARDGDILVFIEVKARFKGKMDDGIRAVNQKKQEHLRYAAHCYLESHPAQQVRFDVVEITASGLRHLKNAF
ncbi:MAG: YraN family protein [Clostridiales bacterium]|nr:YraN family protein [Clostridiales bacterium]